MNRFRSRTAQAVSILVVAGMFPANVYAAEPPHVDQKLNGGGVFMATLGHHVEFQGVEMRRLVVNPIHRTLQQQATEEEVRSVPVQRERTGQPWNDMDYGPFLSAAIEVTPENIASKGIAIPLDAGHSRAMIFDTAELRWAAGWTGDFVELRGIVYDGPHGVWPRIAGEPAWQTPSGPGVGSRGPFRDTREVPFGPLPAEIGRWIGVAPDEKGVVLAYTVADAVVYEEPGLIESDGLTVFTRDIEIHGGTGRTKLMVAGEIDDIEDAPEYHGWHEHGSIMKREGKKPLLFALSDGAKLMQPGIATSGGRTWLAYDSAQPNDVRRARIYLAELNEEADVARFRALVPESRAADPGLKRRFDSASPARWAQRITLEGELDVQFNGDDGHESIRRGAGAPPERKVFEQEPHERPALHGFDGMRLAGTRSSTRDAMLVLESNPGAAPAPIAGWNCDDGEGERMQSVVDGEADLLLDGVTTRRGVSGNALDFDGTARATWTRGNDLEFTETPLTVSAWIRTFKDGAIFAQTNAEGPWIEDGKTLFVRGGHLCYDVGWVGVVCGDRELTDGQWHHVAFTWNPESGEIVLWADGFEEAVGELPPKEAVDGAVMQFGFTAENFPQSPWFSGFMDGVRIHDRVLDGEEIRAVAQESGEAVVRAAAVRGLDATWSIDDGQAMLELPEAREDVEGEFIEWRGPISRLSEFTEQLATKPVSNAPAFKIDRITWPDRNPWYSWMRFGDFDFLDEGRSAVITTWNGDAWRVDGIDRNLGTLEWQRIASGLSQPLGVKTRGDEILVVGRDQVTRLVDLDGDRETDRYEAFNVDAMNSPHFHEPATGLQVDGAGNLYYAKAARHAKLPSHPQHGTVIKLAPDGSSSEIVASGYRAPNGIWVDSDGVIFGSDQEGHWTPANRINRIVPGGFYGNNWSGSRLGKEPRVDYDQPLCWIHSTVDRSPSAQVRVPMNTWGDLAGRLLGISYGTGSVYLILEDEIDGVHQGGVVPLPIEMPTGIMRGRFNPADGDLYVAGLFGWSSNKTDPGGFYRVRRGDTVLPMPLGVRSVRDGLVLFFNEPIATPDDDLADAFSLEAWNYEWTKNYGSLQYDIESGKAGTTPLVIEDASISTDRRTVWLDIPDMKPAMQMHLDWSLEFENASPRKSFVHLTVHKIADASGKVYLD